MDLTRNLMMRALRLFASELFGTSDDPRQEARRERNRRTVEAEKRERNLIPDQFKNDPPPTRVCYDCLWRGGPREERHNSGDVKDPHLLLAVRIHLARYCPDCGAELEAYDAETNGTPERDVGTEPT